MRNALINWLMHKAEICDDIFLITGDLGYSVVEPFAETYKSQFLNAGVAEQNMTGIAAGLALEGFRPYTYSIGIFPTFRCAEQIRNDIDYHNVPVVICAIGSGVAYGNLGYSHHAIQDLSLMRSLPNMLIATPSDPEEVIQILDYQFKNPAPLYLRLHKAGEESLLSSCEEIQPGKLQKIWPIQNANVDDPLNKTCILCVGHIACKVLELFKANGLPYPIYTVPLWGGVATKYFSQQITQYETIITVEDHVLEGGFGSYTLEVVAKYRLNVRVLPIAFQRDVVGKAAKEETLLRPLIADLFSHLESIVNKVHT